MSRWSVQAWSQWSRSGFMAVDFVRASVEHLRAGAMAGPGHINVRLSLLGLTLSVTRYGA